MGLSPFSGVGNLKFFFCLDGGGFTLISQGFLIWGGVKVY